MQIQVSNLHLNLVETDLQRIFKPYGEINTIAIQRDKYNNRSNGRAIVDMPVDKEAQKAILALNGMLLHGKAIVVSQLSESDKQSRFVY